MKKYFSGREKIATVNGTCSHCKKKINLGDKVTIQGIEEWGFIENKYTTYFVHTKCIREGRCSDKESKK